ncbi:hypothetical protein IGB42_00831 [Andreprevotia sp. IGB-42]|uniref:DUF3750 domain-containing protein n=1 Tax=Andreprevotia sp. IGB-42 TaxID=2497473 RepID=UPI00157E48A1|nr:DUF3750 domain-containing protein [Andreprevotia sp. IGB-42]KAF0814776.1 hypothetical protein IGB42_00831 [Andreprevotia sp. IGB-42]
MTPKKKRHGYRIACSTLAVIAVSFGLSLANASQAERPATQTWMTAPRHSAGIAPDPATLADTAIVQVYTATTYGWRGLFAVHPWIIFKRTGDTAYTRYEVVGWRGDDVVQRDYALPDGLWFGAQPQLLVEHRGQNVDAMISRIEAAITSYPFPHVYHAYPGPNSNTFLAHIGREVPELGLDLPANAIGKDYRAITNPVGLSPSGRGLQASVLGLLGFNIGLEEGIEINLLGLDLGVDLNRPALRLPFIGRLGMDDTTQIDHD